MTANTPTPRHSIPVHVLLVAIHEAFHDRWSYGCMTVTKLGEQEILDHLARRGLVPIGLGRLSIAALSRDNLIPHTIVWALRQCAGVRYLTDLSGWTYADVLALERVSRTAVNELQDTMVRYGLLLKGGDPVLLERRPEPAPDRTYRSRTFKMGFMM